MRIPLVSNHLSELSRYWLYDDQFLRDHLITDPEQLPKEVWVAVLYDAVKSFGYDYDHHYCDCDDCDNAYRNETPVPEGHDHTCTDWHNPSDPRCSKTPVEGFSPEGVAFAGFFLRDGSGMLPRDDDGYVWEIAYRYDYENGYGATVGVNPELGMRVACYLC